MCNRLFFKSSMITLGVLIFVFSLSYLDHWLIINDSPQQADIVVVLGGGAAGRLRKGLELYNKGYAKQLVLIDERVSDWTHITQNLCSDCNLNGKNVEILTCSTSTFTDASILKTYCQTHRINKFLVVTDAYHTRRVSLTFANEFKQSGIKFMVINAKDSLFLPLGNQAWWKDEHIRRIVWIETLKCLYVLFHSQ